MILPHSIHHSHPLLHTRSDSNPTDNATQVIVGVVVGGVAVIAMTAGILIFFLKRRKRDHAAQREGQSLALHTSTAHGRKARENDAGTAQRPPSSLSFPHPIHTVGASVDFRARGQSPSPPPAYQPRLPVYDPSRYQRVDAPQHQMGWPSVPMPSHMQAHAYTQTQAQTQRAPNHLASTHFTPGHLVASQQQQQYQHRHQHRHQHQHQHQQQYYLADGAPVPYHQPPLAAPHSETNTNRFSFEPRQSWAQMAPEDVAVARAAQTPSSLSSSPPTEEDGPAGETQRPRRKRPVLSRLITNLG